MLVPGDLRHALDGNFFIPVDNILKGVSVLTEFVEDEATVAAETVLLLDAENRFSSARLGQWQTSPEVGGNYLVGGDIS